MKGPLFWIKVVVLGTLLFLATLAAVVSAVLLLRLPGPLRVQRLEVTFRSADAGAGQFDEGFVPAIVRRLEQRLYRARIEKDVFVTGPEALCVDVPLEVDVAGVRPELETRAVLAFKRVEEAASDESRLRSAIGSPRCPACEVACSTQVPRECYLLHSEAVTNDRWVRAARATVDARYRPSLTLEFWAKGADALKRFSQEHRGHRLALVLDGVVITAPTVEGELGASIEVRGDFGLEESMKLARLLSAGSLPVPVKVGNPRVTLSRPARSPLIGLAVGVFVMIVALAGLVAVVVAQLRGRRAGAE